MRYDHQEKCSQRLPLDFCPRNFHIGRVAQSIFTKILSGPRLLAGSVYIIVTHSVLLEKKQKQANNRVTTFQQIISLHQNFGHLVFSSVKHVTLKNNREWQFLSKANDSIKKPAATSRNFEILYYPYKLYVYPSLSTVLTLRLMHQLSNEIDFVNIVCSFSYKFFV